MSEKKVSKVQEDALFPIGVSVQADEDSSGEDWEGDESEWDNQGSYEVICTKDYAGIKQA